MAGPNDSPQERPAIELTTSEVAEAEAVSFSAPLGEEEEGIYFRAYHPRALAPGVWRKLLVYAHLSEVLDKVERDAGQILGREVGRLQEKSARPRAWRSPPGTEITLVARRGRTRVRSARAGVALERHVAADGLPDEGERAARIGHVANGIIEFFVGPLLVAALRLDIVVIPEEARGEELSPAQEVQSAKMYRSVFASYSHADSRLVEAVEKAYQALGMDYLRDVMTLKTGQSWSEELLRKIEEADVFQLFWSENASRSAYVEQEWRHAIRQREGKGTTFIRPVFWEESLARVPSGALAHPLRAGRLHPIS